MYQSMKLTIALSEWLMVCTRFALNSKVVLTKKDDPTATDAQFQLYCHEIVKDSMKICRENVPDGSGLQGPPV